MFEIPKISGQELNFFSKGASKISKTPFMGVQPHQAQTPKSNFHKELDEVAGFGRQKADTSKTIGLGGASTPSENTGHKIWAYA